MIWLQFTNTESQFKTHKSPYYIKRYHNSHETRHHAFNPQYKKKYSPNRSLYISLKNNFNERVAKRSNLMMIDVGHPEDFRVKGQSGKQEGLFS